MCDNSEAIRLNDEVESNLRALRETEKALAQLALIPTDEIREEQEGD